MSSTYTSMVYQVLEHHVYKSLIGRTCILEAEWHWFVAVEATQSMMKKVCSSSGLYIEIWLYLEYASMKVKSTCPTVALTN